MSRLVRVESVLPAPADAVWAAVQTGRLLEEVAAPLLRFRPSDGGALPERWPLGVPLSLRLYLLGVVPFGPHELVVERVDDAARELQTRERSPLFRRWDHRITVEPVDARRARYVDEVEVDAGWLTPLAAALALVFFRHRHRRWQAVARRLAAAA